MRPADAQGPGNGERLDRLMATLFGLVERRGWRLATLSCAVAMLLAGLAVIATLDDVIGPRHVALVIAMAVASLLATPCLAVAFKLVEHLGRTRTKLIVEIDRRIVAEQQLRRLATTDELTGLANRRHFLDRGREIIALARRSDEWCSFVLIDLDRFKNLNDERGHLAGDDALVVVGDVLGANLRASDLAARLGGDEFVVLMPLTAPETAKSLAERIRRAVRHEIGGLGLSVSIGVASLRAEDVALEGLMARADRALYDAKRAGRNRVALDVASAADWACAGAQQLSIAS